MSNPRTSKSSEPFWWAMFGAGGVISAMLLPVLMLFFGVLVPLGIAVVPEYETVYALMDNWIARVVLMALIALSFFHWAHRFRFTLYDGLQVKHLDALIAIICYGGAVVGSAIAAFFLITF